MATSRQPRGEMRCALCGVDISHKRVDAKYCCRRHKLVFGKREAIRTVSQSYARSALGIEGAPEKLVSTKALLIRIKRVIASGDDTVPRKRQSRKDGENV